MTQPSPDDHREAQGRLESAYKSEKPRFLSRLRAAGRSLQEAEDMVHDLYAETLERLPVISTIRNLPAWINSLFRMRLIDAWRHQNVRKASGEVDAADETVEQILAGAGLNPLDDFVRSSLADALTDAIKVLPPAQRAVIEAQVFRGQTFREISEATGEGIDTLTARKRYAVSTLSRALRHWIDD